MAAVYIYVIILTLVGPEHLRRKFDVEHGDDVRELAGDRIGRGASRGAAQRR